MKRGIFDFGNKGYLILGLILFIVIAIVSVNPNLTGFVTYSSSATKIWSCGNITDAGTYEVNTTFEMKSGYGSSTFGAYEVCLTVQADNVIINGSNYTITTNSTTVKTIAILTANASTRAYTSLTLQNISIWNFSIEVYAAGDGANTAGGSLTFIDDIVNLTGFNATLNGTGTGAAGVFIINYTQAIEDDTNNELGENLGGLRIINRSNGEIKWHAINSSNIGGKLKSNISIRSNLASVEGYTDVLNGSANVTLYSISASLSTPNVYMNHTTICTTCYNYTKLTGSAVTFNVTRWSNYTILDNGTLPLITIELPTNTTYGPNDSPLNFTVSLDKNGTIWFTMNGGTTNFSMLSSLDDVSTFGTVFNYTNASIPNGGYNFTAYANDTSGNRAATESVRFTFDSAVPAVTINLPTAITYTDESIVFNVSLDNNGTVWYSVDTGVTNISMNYSADGISVFGDQFKKSHTFSDGSYTFQVYANDTSGNKNFTESVLFTIDAVAASSGSSGGGSGKVVAVIPKGELEQEDGVTRKLRVRGKVRFVVGDDVHTAELVSCTSSICNFVFESDPINVQLALGEGQNIDLDFDGKNDINVELVSVSANSADLKFLKITGGTSVEVEIESDSEGGTTFVPLSPEEEKSSEGKGLSMGWIIGIVAVILVVLIIVLSLRKRR